MKKANMCRGNFYYNSRISVLISLNYLRSVVGIDRYVMRFEDVIGNENRLAMLIDICNPIHILSYKLQRLSFLIKQTA